MLNRSQVKRDFSNEQIIKVVLALGSDDYREDKTLPDSPLIFQTICHNPAHCGSYKLYYYPDSHQFHCYTQCSCNFDVYELVMRSRKCSFFEAMTWVKSVLELEEPQKLGFFSEEQEPQETDDWELLNKYASRRKQTRPVEDYIALSPALLDYYTNVYPVECLRDGISPEAMDRFNIRFNIAGNEIVIPHYDRQNRLIGIRSRSFEPFKVEAGNKYMPTFMEGKDFRHSLRNNLYGLNVCESSIKRIGKIMLCESEKAAMQSYTMYGENSFTVAVCGSNISNAQRDLVLSLGVREVFIGFDKEYHEAYSDESDAYADKLLHLAGMFAPYVVTYVLFDTQGLLGYKDSPTDRGQAVLEALMRSKIEIETLSGG